MVREAMFTVQTVCSLCGSVTASFDKNNNGENQLYNAQISRLSLTCHRWVLSWSQSSI